MSVYNRFSAIRLMLLGSTVLSIGLVGNAQVAPPEDEVKLETVTVTGYRLQNALSVERKQNSDIAAEFLSSDQVGQQPDYNISDSFRRAPGVVTVFDEDEGRYVGVRGLNPDFTAATIDGALMAAAERGNRRINLEAIPSPVVKRLEILKSRTPEMDGTAIGGTIELVTRSAFDTEGRFLVGSAFVGTYDSTDVPGEGFNRDSDDGLSYRGDVTWSDTFGASDQFGIVAAGSYSRKRRDQERYLPSGFTNFNGVPVPGSTIFSSYPNTVDRYGGFLKFEYRPTDALDTEVFISHFQQDDNELRNTHIVDRRGTVTTNGNDAFATQGRAALRFNDFPIEKPLTTINARAEWRLDDNQTLDARVSYSEATFLEPSNELRFTSANNNPGLAFGTRVNGVIPSINFVNPAFFADGANYAFTSYDIYEDDSNDQVQEFEVNYGINSARGDLGWGVKVGAKLRDLTRDNGRSGSTIRLAAGQTLTARDFVQSSTYAPLGLANPSIFLDFGAFQEFLGANPSVFTVTTPTNATTGDYRLEEEIGAAYVQASYTADRYKVIFGGRFEQTETLVERTNTVTTGTATSIVPVTRENSYDNFLPSVTGYYDLTSQLKVRAAYYQGVGRPNPANLASGETRNDNTNPPTVSRGNPDLKARTADSYDVSLEYYLPDNDGLIALAAFRKEISDEIFTGTRSETIDGVLVDVTQPINVADATISGVEFSVVKNTFEFLPGPLKGLGGSFNYTWFDGETDVVAPNGTSRTLDRLPQQPDFTLNASLFYAYGPSETRLTFARVGEIYTAVNTGATGAAGDRFDVEFDQLDLQTRFRLSESLQLIGEVRNLTDERRENYENPSNPLPRDINQFGRAFWIGATVKY